MNLLCIWYSFFMASVAPRTAQRYLVLRWLASGEHDLDMKCIFDTQRSTGYRYEVSRATLASSWRICYVYAFHFS